MGSWGAGLRQNDDAADALGIFEKDIAKVIERREGQDKLLCAVAKRFKNRSEYVLGVADELLDHKIDLKASREMLVKHFEKLSTKEELSRWVDVTERVHALGDFKRRLYWGGKGLTEQEFSTRKYNKGLLTVMAEKLAKLSLDSEGLTHRISPKEGERILKGLTTMQLKALVKLGKQAEKMLK